MKTFRVSGALASLAVVMLLAGSVAAQIVTLGPPPPTTKLETFERQEGVTLVHGRSRIGHVQDLHGGLVRVTAREMRNTATGETASGVTIEVLERNGGEEGRERRGVAVRESVSYIDYDELSGLIRGLEQLARLNRASTRLDQFGGEYRTKGYFHVSVRGFGNDVSVTVSSGLIDPVTSTFQITDLSKIHDLLVNALVKLDAIK